MSKLTTSSHYLNRRFPVFVTVFLICFCFKQSYSQTAIDLSRPVAMTAGEAGSNGAGAATYSIPIDLPSGVKGVQPGINISYSSQGNGNGYSGHGWSLSGISMITRAGKNVFHNGIATPVNYTGANDAFVMDGQRLMLISGTNGAAGSVYGTEQETFSKIEATAGNGNSPDWFKVTTKNGTILEYGSDNSKLKTNDGNNLILWLLRRVKDASGNFMEYTYSIDNTNRYYSLSSITYTGNSNTGTPASYQVVFTYSAKTDYQSCPLYISGSSVYSARILNKIDVKKMDGTQIRSYAFAYQYREKKYFLNTVTEAGSDGVTLNPITFTYGENTSAVDVSLTAENGYSTDRNYTGDFDGDGRTDIQSFSYKVNTSTGETWYKKYQIYDYNAGSIGEKYPYDMGTDIPGADIKVMGKDAAQNPFAVSDFDGDGKEDILLAKFNTNNYTLKGININYSRVKPGLNPGDKYLTYKKVAYDNLPASFYGQHTLWKQGGSFFASGDFDGDGHLDYILILGISGYTNAYKAFLSSPSKNIINREIASFGVGVNGASGDFAANAIAESKAIIPVNFDGDGKTELLVVRNEGSYVVSIYPVPASSGYSYGSSVLYFTPDIKTDYKIFPGDFNGDGNTDLFVRASKNVPSTPWKIFLSTGKAFTQSAFYGAYTIILPGDGYSNAHMLSVGDYDGDGKSDILHSLDATTSSSNHVFYYFNGSSFSYEINGLSQSINTQSMYSGGDFNGDGKPDFLKVRNASTTSFYVRFLMAKPFKEKNLLVGASNLGYLTSFDYALLNGKDNSYPSVYSRTGFYDYSYDDAGASTPYFQDYMEPAPAMYVLSKIKHPNGLGGQSNETYYYEDLVVHPSGRGFLGFKKTDVSNDMGVINRVWNTVNLPYSMVVPDITQTYLNSGGMFTRSRFTTSFKQVSVSSYLDRRFFMKQDRVFTHNWLTNESSEAVNTYDDYGNVTQSVVKAGPSDDFNLTSTLETTTTTTAFGTYGGAAYPGFPTSTTITKIRGVGPQVSKTTNYAYTTQGLPETVTENVGTPPIVTTVTNTYNGFGLPTQTTTSAPGVTMPVINYVYDTKGQFVLEKKITGGGITKKETATYDDRWQEPLSKTSTDGLITTYQYDNFGLLKQTNFPGGNSAITTKGWVTSGNARYSVLTQRTDGSSPVKVYIDILGREIKTEKIGFNNQWLTSEKAYNPYGWLISESVPHYSTEPANNTNYYYDSYGRPYSVSTPTGTISTTYTNTGGASYTVKTTKGSQWTSKTADASGKITASSDNGVDMAFTYDSWGNQLTAGSNGQTFVTNVYDSYGRKQSTTDVNAGTISYQYNALGQITQQTDAKGQTQTTNYDVFGRVATTTVGPQETTTYTYYYDAGTQKSNDNITQVTGFSGDVRTYQYDNLQRLSSESMATGSTTLSKSYTYDTHGNLATTTYPAGFLIRNVYDNNDILTGTEYEQGSTIKNLFTATAMNSRGIYTGYSTGNGKTKSVTYDFTKEAVSRYYTAGIQDLNMVYEAVTLNLLSRKDMIRNLTETFTYDINDRLTSAKVNGVQQFAMSYDAGAQGKILEKTDIGKYNYDAQKVHQLKYLTPLSGGADPATVIGINERDITYTTFLKTATIAENNYLLTYSYGSDQQRLTSQLKQNGTLVETKTYWGNMEKMTKGPNTYEIYYIPGGNGLNNIIVKQNSTISIYYTYTDHLGSITAVTNEAGTIVAEQNFDAWGRYRNPANWTYTGIPARPDWLYRGFTGHEHLAAFNLINMNGRMYDPMTGMMMSPDNYIPMPWSPGGYNRYNYAYGNPLKFTDPDGEWFGVDDLIVSAIGFVTGYVSHGISTGNWGWDAVKAGGITAVASWLGYNTAGAATAFLSKTAGFSAGASSVIGQGIGGAVGSTFGNGSSQLIFNHSLNWSQLGKSALYGFGSGIGTGLFDQSGLLTKHFPMSHTIKYLMRSTAGELAGSLATGGDFSNMTFGLNLGLALPLASDITSVTSPLWATKKANKIMQKKLAEYKETIGVTSNVNLHTTIDYGAYSLDDGNYIYLSDDKYLFDEVGIYAQLKLSGGFSIDRISDIPLKGLSVPNLSPISINIPVFKLPFTISNIINFSGIYTNMYRYARP